MTESESAADFMKRMEGYVAQSIWQDSPDFVRLFALARRGAEAAARIERLEGALREIAQNCNEHTRPGATRGHQWAADRANAALEDRG